MITIIAVQSMAQEKWAFGQSKTTGWRRETSNEYAGVATCAELIEELLLELDRRRKLQRKTRETNARRE